MFGISVFPRDLVRLTKPKKLVISYYKKRLTQRRVNHYVILCTSSLYDFRSFRPGTDQSRIYPYARPTFPHDCLIQQVEVNPTR